MTSRVKRVLLSAATAVVGLGVTAGIALWIALSVWVPVRGKALVIRALEQRWPVQVSIQRLRCPFWRGVMLDQVEITDRATHEVWGVLPRMEVHVNWLALLLIRQVTLRGIASVRQPIQAELSFTANDHLKNSSWSGAITTSSFSLGTVTAPLNRFLPPELTDGTMRLDVNLAQPSTKPLLIAVDAKGERLLWNAASWTLSGDVQLRGTVAPPITDRPWTVEGDAVLQRGTLKGVAAIGPIEQLEGQAHFTPARLEITQLRGTALGSSWTLEGAVIRAPQPSFEALLVSRVRLTRLASAWPAVADWHPEGEADVRAVCRGPLAPISAWDCLAQATADHAALTVPQWSQPLTDLAARLTYDVMSRRISIETLRARFMQEPFTCSGDIELTRATDLALHVAGQLPLAHAESWLPVEFPVRELEGFAAFDLQLQGPVDSLRPTGTIVLHEAAAHMTHPEARLEHVESTVRLETHDITVSGTTGQLNGLALTLDGTMTRSDMPRITATVGFPQGQAQLAGRVLPQEILVEPSLLSLGTSRLTMQGRLSRTLEQPSLLDLSGTVELEDLTRALVFSAPWLNAWELRGVTNVRARFDGAFAHWQQAVMTGELRAQALRVRNVPVEQVVCRIEHNPRGCYARIPSARVADGKLIGEFALEHRAGGDYGMLQADITAMQLARLTQAVPAWRSRAVTGDASIHAMVSGMAQQRATWLGEGWLNASGRQLGDIPLLDTLFRGLFGVLGDRLGLESLRRAEITNVSLQWQLAHEQVMTDSLRVGGMAGPEPVAIYGHGHVGLDGRLDLIIEPELSEGVLAEAPALSTLAGTVLKAAGQLERLRRLIGRHHVTGTIRDPAYRFEFTTQEIFKQLAPGTAGGLLQQLLEIQ